jgi:PemK-like, MazF-like toxin of type II toxin-antitoxin system
MPFEKGEIISFTFQMPDNGDWVEHPAVILSCDDVYKHDKCYVCAMMTSNGANDIFSFPLQHNDLEKKSNKPNSQVRCHLITYVLEADIHHSNPFNKLKKQSFERLIAQINVSVFDI